MSDARTMPTRRAPVAILAAGLAAALMVACMSERTAGPPADQSACGVQLPSEAFGSTVVVIRDFAFTPARVRVHPGATVTWVNCGETGSDSHTSTADAGAWSSPLIAPGTTFTRDFGAAGSFAYHCEPHPGMTGSVTVE